MRCHPGARTGLHLPVPDQNSGGGREPCSHATRLRPPRLGIAECVSHHDAKWCGPTQRDRCTIMDPTCPMHRVEPLATIPFAPQQRVSNYECRANLGDRRRSVGNRYSRSDRAKRDTNFSFASTPASGEAFARALTKPRQVHGAHCKHTSRSDRGPIKTRVFPPATPVQRRPAATPAHCAKTCPMAHPDTEPPTRRTPSDLTLTRPNSNTRVATQILVPATTCHKAALAPSGRPGRAH